MAAGVAAGIVGGVTEDFEDGTRSPSLVLPTPWAFGIWGPIYAGAVGYATHTARPSRRTDPLLRRTGWPVALAYALAGLWVRVPGPPRRQLPAIAGTVAAAATAYQRAAPRRGEADGAAEAWLVRVPLALFAGWVTVAAAAGTTEVVIGEGYADLPPGRTPWAVAVVGLAGGVATWVTRRHPVSPAYPAAVAWGLGTAAVRALPRRRLPGMAALLAAGAVAAAARR
ncbi:hypothetical protein D0Z06_05090 [Geodermatophilus marinus]|nr:hypothetical protein D0Z06_05090 [Geodermatophilus sp. LHW52908]